MATSDASVVNVSFIPGLGCASKSFRAKTTGFGKHGRSAGWDSVSYPVGIAVSAKDWLLYFWEFLQQVAVFPGDLDDLIVEG